MTKLRVPIWQLMLAVMLCGVGFAALKNPTLASAGWVFLATSAVLVLGIVGVASRRGRTRLGYLGFVLFGSGYLILALSTGELVPPHLPTNPLLDQIQQMLHPPQPPALTSLNSYSVVTATFTPITAVDTYSDFHRIGHSLITFLFGILGSVLARFFGTKPTETEPTERKGTTS